MSRDGSTFICISIELGIEELYTEIDSDEYEWEKNILKKKSNLF